jgi:hypothetical protein
VSAHGVIFGGACGFLEYCGPSMTRIYLRNFPRPIKILNAHYNPMIVNTLDGTRATYSDNVHYDNIAELLTYNLEGIIGALALTHRELIICDEDEYGEEEEDSNIASIVSKY